jgi:DNA polymerase-3 subunit gamma/tau
MTYIVLARKWRPMQFEEVVGQEHITRTLKNALQNNRIAHAFIFAGPRGVGKTTTARLLAKTVNCAKQPVDDPTRWAVNPCNECSSCKSITNGNSLDVIEIDGASNRGIDEIRNLRENIRFAPASSRYKIYIIDEVHMLTKDAFNALLKTLEEPPPHAIFIFATTEIHKVPLTILSRCQRFDFKRIPTADIAHQLEMIAKSEKIKIDKDSLILIARKSEGSMRDAESIMDQMISYTDGKITVAEVQSSLGLISEELYFEYTDLMLQKPNSQSPSDADIINYAQKVFNQGHDLLDFIYGLQEHFRNLLVTRATDSIKLLETSDHFKNLYQEKAGQFSENDLLHYIDLLTQSEALLKFSPNPQLILELLLLKLAHKPLSIELGELLNYLKSNNPPDSSGTSNPDSSVKTKNTSQQSPKKKIETNDLRPAYQAAASKKTSNPFDSLKSDVFPKASVTVQEDKIKKTYTVDISITDIQNDWDKIVEEIKKQKIALASFLIDGFPYKMKDNLLEIAFDPKTQFHMEHIQKNAGTIENLLETKFHAPIRIKCTSLDFESAGIEKKVRSPEEVIEDIKSKEPVLKKIIEVFDCKEIEGGE